MNAATHDDARTKTEDVRSKHEEEGERRRRTFPGDDAPPEVLVGRERAVFASLHLLLLPSRQTRL